MNTQISAFEHHWYVIQDINQDKNQQTGNISLMEVITQYNYFKALKVITPQYLSSRYAQPPKNVPSCCRDKWAS